MPCMQFQQHLLLPLERIPGVVYWYTYLTLFVLLPAFSPWCSERIRELLDKQRA
jgi:hypothetical protein